MPMQPSGQQANVAAPSPSSGKRLFPGREILSWLPLIGLVLMVINDHLFRRAHPGWVTGKVSDFAVVVYFPFLVTSVVRLGALLLDKLFYAVSSGSIRVDWGFTKKQLAFGILVTGLALTAINTSVIARDAYIAVLERIDVLSLFGRFDYVMDPTDCTALVMLPAVWVYGVRRFVHPG